MNDLRQNVTFLQIALYFLRQECSCYDYLLSIFSNLANNFFNIIMLVVI